MVEGVFAIRGVIVCRSKEGVERFDFNGVCVCGSGVVCVCVELCGVRKEYKSYVDLLKSIDTRTYLKKKEKKHQLHSSIIISKNSLTTFSSNSYIPV